MEKSAWVGVLMGMFCLALFTKSPFWPSWDPLYAFSWQKGELHGVDLPDPIEIDTLTGYETQ